MSLYQTALAQTIHKDFEIVREPGPDTVVIHAAITEARQSKPVLNLVSSVYPASVVASYGKQMITGTGTGVLVWCGLKPISPMVELASVWQRELMRGPERSLGFSKFDQHAWGDVKLAFDFWSARFVARLKSFQQGDFGPL